MSLALVRLRYVNVEAGWTILEDGPLLWKSRILGLGKNNNTSSHHVGGLEPIVRTYVVFVSVTVRRYHTGQ